jgi:hypothetical protein
MSSACFETEGSSSGRRMYIQVWYGVFDMHRYEQCVRCQKKNLVPTRHQRIEN